MNTKFTLKLLAGLLLFSTLNSQFLAFAQGNAFTYQGRLNVGGNPTNGFYDFQFQVFDAAPVGTGTSSGSPNPNQTNGVAVSNGLFTVTLDFGAGVFTGPPRWLQTFVRTNGNGAFTSLSPRQALTATPYALYSGNAAALGGQASTAYVAKAGDTMTGRLNLLANGLTVGGSQVVVTNGNVGIGTPNPGRSLDVQNANGSAFIQVKSTGSGGGILSLDRVSGSASYSSQLGFATAGINDFAMGTSQGSAGISDFSIYDYGSANNVLTILKSSGNVGIGTANPSEKLEVTAGNILVGNEYGLSGKTTGGTTLNLIKGNNSDNVTIGSGSGWSDVLLLAGTQERVRIKNNGNVGIGTTSPDSILETVGGNVHIHGQYGIYFEGGPVADPNYFVAPFTLAAAAGMRVSGYRGVRLSTGQGDILNVADNMVGIGTTGPDAALHVINPTGFNLAGIHIEQPASFDFAQIRLNVTGSPYWNLAVGGGSTPPLNFGFNNNLMMSLGSDGTLQVKVLQINGADMAEPFELTTKDIPKGSVVVIDEENSGKVRLSTRAYDVQVAGILSGANGVNSGICLKQQGFNDGGENVALSGRVYALADATYAAIKTGDLLTTSDTPGHCMKVTDHAKAQGAIIGKAMSSLKDGKGMVLVLVSLQ